MARALDLAASPGVPLGPNPRVGCVLLGPGRYDGRRGLPPRRRPPHAEADALAGAGGPAPGHDRRGHPRALQPHRSHRPVRAGARRRRGRPRGVRAVRHQPGRHRGRRDACARRASTSRPACWPTQARAVNRVWTFAVEHGRPFVTWKFATTLDGRSAAADGTSRWVSSLPARRDTHRLRGAVRRDPGRHRHGAGRRPAAHGPRRGRPGPAPRAAAAARGDGPARRARRPPGARRRGRDRAAAHPRPARGARRPARPRPAARVPRGRPDPRGGLPRAPGSSTRSSATSRRCCSAPGSAPSATWASPTIADALHLDVDRRDHARRRRGHQRPAHHDPRPRPAKETV